MKTRLHRKLALLLAVIVAGISLAACSTGSGMEESQLSEEGSVASEISSQSESIYESESVSEPEMPKESELPEETISALLIFLIVLRL